MSANNSNSYSAQRRNAQSVSTPLAKWQQDLEQLKEKPPTATPQPRKRNKRGCSSSAMLTTRLGSNPKPSEVMTYKMTEKTRLAMNEAARQMSHQEQRAIRDKVARTDWANLVRSEHALEHQILDYLAASPNERAFIDYELQQVINRKTRQGRREQAQWVIAIRKQMKSRLR